MEGNSTEWGLAFEGMNQVNKQQQNKQARKSSEDTQAVGYARFEKVWAG